MKPKILITVKGGIVINVTTTEPMDVIIEDQENLETIVETYEPDLIIPHNKWDEAMGLIYTMRKHHGLIKK